jgi:hypothetical protein
MVEAVVGGEGGAEIKKSNKYETVSKSRHN